MCCLSTVAGRALAGLVQAAFALAAVAAVAVTLRYRRFRLLAGLAAGAVLAGAVLTGIVYLAGGERPRALAAGAGSWWWLTGASLLGPALLAAAVAVTVAAAPWLSRPWRRTAWIVLWLAAIARLITGTASPVEVVLAFATGITVGAGVLVLFGVPDRRIGPAEIAVALGSAGLPVTHVEPAAVEAKGSRPFTADADDWGAAVHQGPWVGSAGRRPALPGVPVHPPARRRRHPPRRLPHPGRGAPGARRGHG